MSIPLLVTFVGGTTGQWRVDRISAVIGEALPIVERLAVLEGRDRPPVDQDSWALRGVTSNIRYTRRDEADSLIARQEGLERPQATKAALIPIRKTEAWWDLAQDERREDQNILELDWSISRR